MHVAKTFISYYALMCLLLSCKCNVNWDWVPRVVNGKPASLGQVPYQVAFKAEVRSSEGRYKTFCGGALITPRKTVSAAHCFVGRKGLSSGVVSEEKLRIVHVVAGNLMNDVVYVAGLNGMGQWQQLNYMKHPKEYLFPDNDISVGFTAKPFVINSHVKPIRFARRHTDYPELKECLVSGYGRINNFQISDRLLVADMYLMPKAECSSTHQRNMDKFICIYNQVTDVNKGDSGSPLICDNQLVGIVSGHRFRAGSFFTRISSYADFIAPRTSKAPENCKTVLGSKVLTVLLFNICLLLNFDYYFDCDLLFIF